MQIQRLKWRRVVDSQTKGKIMANIRATVVDSCGGGGRGPKYFIDKNGTKIQIIIILYYFTNNNKLMKL